jgi:hypothetical protein
MFWLLFYLLRLIIHYGYASAKALQISHSISPDATIYDLSLATHYGWLLILRLATFGHYYGFAYAAAPEICL